MARSERSESRASFAAIAALAGPAQRPLVEALRALILAVHPEAHETAWPALRIASYGLGPRKRTEHYAYLAVHARHVNLGLYHGAVLQAGGVRLEGTGVRLRHVKLAKPADLEVPALRALVAAALEERRAATRGTAPRAGA